MMTDQPDVREQLGLGPTQYIRLTEDEMALVLAAMKIPRIMGYELPDDVSPESMRGARNTLRARGGALLQPDGTLVIDAQIAEMVGKGARWARLITVALKYANGQTDTYWIYMGRGAPVLHAIPEPGVHQFQTIPDGKSLLLALAGLLHLRLRDQTMPQTAAFELDPQVLDDADRILTEQGPEAAYDYLLDAELPPSFAQAAVAPVINAAVSVTWPTTGLPNEQGVIEFTERPMWLWGVPDNGGYWMLFPDKARRIVQVTPANPGKVMSVISNFVVEDLPAPQ